MKLAIMQPYFFPYIGYWQLINAVDKFVVYNNIKFTKSGWIRKNRILVNGTDKIFSLPLKGDSDFLDIRERVLADNYEESTKKILNQIKMAYKMAPQFENVYPIIEKCVECQRVNLFEYIYESIVEITQYLDINTEIIISSTIDMDHSLKNKDRVIGTCKALNAVEYVNPIGGLELYQTEEFLNNGIRLCFLRTGEIVYNQFENQFIPNLSIIDVMMFNSKEKVKDMLNKYTLISGMGKS